MSAHTISVFVKCAQVQFEFLIEEFGFHLTVNEQQGPEAMLMFDSSGVRICVHYEQGTPPWVQIDKQEHRSDGVIAVDETSLDVLMVERGLLPRPMWTAGLRDLHDEELERYVADDALLLKTILTDILRGDTSSLKAHQSEGQGGSRKT